MHYQRKKLNYKKSRFCPSLLVYCTMTSWWRGLCWVRRWVPGSRIGSGRSDIRNLSDGKRWKQTFTSL